MSLYIGNKKVTPIKVSGSETIRLQNKDITDNGVYNADEGYTGLGTVNVQVPKGTTPSGNIDITENGSYDVANYATASVNVSGGGDFIGIPREVTSDGVFQVPSQAFDFYSPANANSIGALSMQLAFYRSRGVSSANLPSVTSVGDSALSSAFAGCPNLTKVDLSSLVALDATGCCGSAFDNCTSLTNIDLSSLQSISGTQSCQRMFSRCTSLTNIDLSSLQSISGTQSCYQMFGGCTSLTNIDLSSLSILEGSSNCGYMFEGCTSLTNITFNSLEFVRGVGTLSYMFYRCSSLTMISFPSLKSADLSAFSNFLVGVDGCTVHFPSNLESTIGEWSITMGGFSGTNITVLFDLPATT